MKKWMHVIGGTLLAMFAYYIIETAFRAVFQPLFRSAVTEGQQAQYVLFANMAVKAVTLLVFGLWYKAGKYGESIRRDPRRSFTAKTVFSLAAIGLFGQYAVSFLMQLLRLAVPSIFEDYDAITQTVSLDNNPPYLVLILVVALGPMAEEFLFRGVIYGNLRDVFPAAQAAVISGAIFGIYHNNLVQGIYASLFGVLLAYIFEETGTIWCAAVMHMVFNLSSYLLQWISQALQRHAVALPDFSYFLLDAASILIVVLALISLKKNPGGGD